MNFTVPLDALRAVTRVVTHADCPDGIASAMILHDALPQASIEFIQYGSPEHRDLVATPGMLFCDMTPPRERVAEFVAAGAIVADHHKAQEDIVRAFGARGVFADETAHPGVSGAWLALLTRVALHHNALAANLKLARLAGIRDTWQRHDPEWKEACAQAEVLRFYGAAWLLENRPSELYAEDIELGRLLLEKRLSAARNIAQHKLYRLGIWRLFNDGDKALGHEMISDVAETVRELDPDAEGVAGFRYRVESDGSISLVFSLRSCGGIDVSEIAKTNGGGGHAGAAGFTVQLTGDDGLRHRLDPLTIFPLCLPVPS